MNEDHWKFCEDILPEVSRTFAINIKALKGDLYKSVLLSYLFCRIIDTIEDAPTLAPNLKIELLTQFKKIFSEHPFPINEVRDWVKNCAVVDGSVMDLKLLRNADKVFSEFAGIPEFLRSKVIPPVLEMASGMIHYSEEHLVHGELILKTEKELEKYCYTVAGTVGKLLCESFIAVMQSDDSVNSILREHAVSFGLGLQMTNIAKDVMADRKRNVTYIPEEYLRKEGVSIQEFRDGNNQIAIKVIDHLILKAAGHLEDALIYTLAIPKNYFTIRLFCLWPLWMALETLAMLRFNENLLVSSDSMKISRAKVLGIVQSTTIRCVSNRLLKADFEKIMSRLRNK